MELVHIWLGLSHTDVPRGKEMVLDYMQLKKLTLPKIFLEPLVGRGLETPKISV